MKKFGGGPVKQEEKKEYQKATTLDQNELNRKTRKKNKSGLEWVV